jgi:hypothetical protein
MSDAKPGCIEPGEHGCIWGPTFMAIAIILMLVLTFGCGGGGGGPELPAPPAADATTDQIDEFLNDYLAWLQAQDDPAAAARQVESDPRYAAWVATTEGE